MKLIRLRCCDIQRVFQAPEVEVTRLVSGTPLFIGCGVNLTRPSLMGEADIRSRPLAGKGPKGPQRVICHQRLQRLD